MLIKFPIHYPGNTRQCKCKSMQGIQLYKNFINRTCQWVSVVNGNLMLPIYFNGLERTTVLGTGMSQMSTSHKFLPGASRVPGPPGRAGP